jgi:heterodisulfide reductase subunit C2
MISTAERPLRVASVGDFAREVEAESGASLAACLQCAKCTSGCAVASRADIKPHEMVRLVQFGARDEVLSSRMIWECTSCETCAARCPQGVSVAAMMDALRRLSRASGKTSARTDAPAFNDVFLGSVKQAGRVYEVGLMAAFKLRTRSLTRDMDKVPVMLLKRKLALLPSFVKGRGERRRLFRRAGR